MVDGTRAGAGMSVWSGGEQGFRPDSVVWLFGRWWSVVLLVVEVDGGKEDEARVSFGLRMRCRSAACVGICTFIRAIVRSSGGNGVDQS